MWHKKLEPMIYVNGVSATISSTSTPFSIIWSDLTSTIESGGSRYSNLSLLGANIWTFIAVLMPYKHSIIQCYFFVQFAFPHSHLLDSLFYWFDQGLDNEINYVNSHHISPIFLSFMIHSFPILNFIVFFYAV